MSSLDQKWQSLNEDLLYSAAKDWLRFCFKKAPQVRINIFLPNSHIFYTHFCGGGWETYWEDNDEDSCLQCGKRGAQIFTIEDWAETVFDPLTATLWACEFEANLEQLITDLSNFTA